MFVHRGKANTRTMTRARVPLKLAEGWRDEQITTAFDICRATVSSVRKRFNEGGLEVVLHDRVQQRRRQALSGHQARGLPTGCATREISGKVTWERTLWHPDMIFGSCWPLRTQPFQVIW